MRKANLKLSNLQKALCLVILAPQLSCSGFSGQNSLSKRSHSQDNTQLCGTGQGCQNPNDTESQTTEELEGSTAPGAVTGTNLVSFESIRNRCSQSMVSNSNGSKKFIINCKIFEATPLGGEIPVTKIPTELTVKYEPLKILSSLAPQLETDCQITAMYSYSCTISSSTTALDLSVEIPLSVTENTQGNTRSKTEAAEMLLSFKVRTYGLVPEADSLHSTLVNGSTAFSYTPTVLSAFEAALPDLTGLSFCNGRLFVKSGPLVYVVIDGKIQHFAGSMLANSENQNYAKRIYLGSDGHILCSDGTLFLSSNEMNRIIAIDIASGISRTLVGRVSARGFAGDKSQAVDATVDGPIGLMRQGDDLIFADSGNNKLRIVHLTTGVIDSLSVTFAADFIGTPGFRNPSHLVSLSEGAFLVSDTGNHRIIQIDKAGKAKIVAGIGSAGSLGNNAPAVLAMLNQPKHIVSDGEYIFVNDSGNQQVRRFKVGGAMEPYSGSGSIAAGDLAANVAIPLAAVKWPDITAMAPGAQGHLFVGSKQSERVLSLTNGNASNFAGYIPAATASHSSSMRFWNVTGLAVKSAGDIYMTEASSHLVRHLKNDFVDILAGMQDPVLQNSLGDGSAALGSWIVGPSNILLSRSGEDGYVVATTLHNRIRKINSSGNISTILGGSSSTSLQLDVPGPNADFAVTGLAATSDALFIADTGHHKILKYNIASNLLSTFVGTGTAGQAAFEGAPGSVTAVNQPEGLAIWRNRYLVFSDRGNHFVKMARLDGSRVYTIAGIGQDGDTKSSVNATETAVSFPGALTVWPDGTIVVVANNRKVLLLKPNTITAADPTFSTDILFGNSVPVDCGTGIFQDTAQNSTTSEVWSGALSHICPGTIYGVSATDNCSESTGGEFTTAFSQSLAKGKGSSMVVTLTASCQ